MLILPADRRLLKTGKPAASRRPRAAKPAAITETQEHRTIVAYLRKVELGGTAYWFHPAGERHGDGQRIIAARMGVRGGLPDFGFVNDGRSGWCELKPRGWIARTARTGNYTAHEFRQLDTHSALRLAGAWVEICETLDDVLAALARNGVPLRTEAPVIEAMRGAVSVKAGEPLPDLFKPRDQREGER